MKLLILASVLVAAVSAAPGRRWYGRPKQSYGSPEICDDGEVINVDGSCVKPKVHRQVYVFTAPYRPKQQGPPPYVPRPEVHTNIVLIRVPEEEEVDDIVVPAPRQKNVVYVLNERKQDDGPRVIEVPDSPQINPEVYFVNYEEGENPELPGGIDLRTALSKAAHAGGQIIEGDEDEDEHGGGYGHDFDEDFGGDFEDFHGGGGGYGHYY